MHLFRCAYLPLLAGATLLLAACHRDTPTEGPAYDLSGRYTPAPTLTAAHPVAMYTKDGQVTNAAVVTRFLARRPTLGGTYFSATDVPISGNGVYRLVFRGGNRVTLLSTLPTSTDSIRTEVTNQQPDSFLLQNLDSTSLSTSASQSPCNHLDGLVPYVRGTDWGRKCRATSPVTGYSQLCRVRPVRVVRARGSQLYIPYYSWLIQTGPCYGAVGGDWNTFNPGIVSQLAVGDTLVVQEREVLLNR